MYKFNLLQLIVLNSYKVGKTKQFVNVICGFTEMLFFYTWFISENEMNENMKGNYSSCKQ